MQPEKSVPRSLLVNRFAVLDVEEANTDICEPIDAPPLLQTGQHNPEGQNGKRGYPNDSLSTPSMLMGCRLSCQ